MGILKTIGGAIAGLFVKKVTIMAPDGEEITKTQPREGTKGLGWIVGFLVLWHFVGYPILSYHFPHYQFPSLDGGWLSGIFLGL